MIKGLLDTVPSSSTDSVFSLGQVISLYPRFPVCKIGISSPGRGCIINICNVYSGGELEKPKHITKAPIHLLMPHLNGITHSKVKELTSDRQLSHAKMPYLQKSNQ